MKNLSHYVESECGTHIDAYASPMHADTWDLYHEGELVGMVELAHDDIYRCDGLLFYGLSSAMLYVAYQIETMRADFSDWSES